MLGILGPPGKHTSRWIRDLWSKGVLLILAYFLDIFDFLPFGMIFFCFQKNQVLGLVLVQQNMVETTHLNGLQTSGQRAYRKFWHISRRFLSFCVLDDFFFFSKKSGFRVFLVHPTMVSVLLSASVERCFVSRMQDFFLLYLSQIKTNMKNI